MSSSELEKEIPGFTGFEIAVIGMSGKFPGARNIEEFWENIKNGKEGITFFTDEELKESGVSDQMLENHQYIKAYGWLEGTLFFDAAFFGYTPMEAELMDPQVRLFHECVHAALENAGYDPSTYNKPIGLYAGASANLQWQANTVVTSVSGWFASKQLTDKDFLATRIAYKLNLQGPAMTVDTACSTSLTTIHLAIQGLLIGDCDIALAGGVTAINYSKSGYFYEEGMILSPDGHTRTFDAKARGSNFGDAAAVVVLKRYNNAAEDKDTICAVIKGSALNNDGNRKTAYTAPSVKGQAGVIRSAQKMAEVDPESITYVETHGTATFLGDPVEIQGLKMAFNTNKKGFCGIGSIKSNVGHLESAAGAAGFIKTVLALKHRLLPPTLHFEVPNPGIDFINSPFYINTKLTAWENQGYPLRAGVSSFGIGGTNAHVILEEAPIAQGAERKAQSAGRQHQLILLSAKTPSALEKMTENLANHFKKNPHIHLADAAYTLQVGRQSFKYRKMFVCSCVQEAAAVLSGTIPGKIHNGAPEEENTTSSPGESPGRLENLIKDARPGSPELHDLLEKIGLSWLRGENIEWCKLYPGEKRRRIPLPVYPFEGKRYRIDSGNFMVTATEKQDTYKAASPTKKLYPRPELSTDYTAPVNETEEKLAGIWQNFFGFDQIGSQDDFFELGGNSLTLITLIYGIREEMEILVPIPEFFTRPNIGALTRYILDNPQKASPVSIDSVEKREYYPLALTQERIYIMQQMDPGNISYNIPFVYILDLKVDINKFREIFKKMILRQETLRTSFHMVNSGAVQKIHQNVDFAIEYYDMVGKAEENLEEIIKNFIRPFDLCQPPLLRVGLIKIAESKNLLMTDMHHLISDGISMMNTIKDFLLLYHGKELPGLPLQYKDYSMWQILEKEKGALKKQEEYWVKEFSGDIPGFQLHLDYPRPAVQSFEGSLVTFEIDAAHTQGLKILAESESATLFMVLLAVYNVLLSRLSGQEDIIIGTGIAGRNFVELQPLVGMFINTVALRNSPGKEKTFKNFLQEIKEKTLTAFANQDYPFDLLVEKVVPQRARNRNPLFDVFLMSLVVDNSSRPDTTASSASPPAAPQGLPKYNYTHRVSKFDLGLLYTEVAGRLEMDLEYCTKLFKPGTVERFGAFFKDIVSAVTANKNIKLGEIKISHKLLAAKEDVVPDESEDFRF
jgi:3-oxoacyl-(acyl-carrier-protein) synthase/acyl carrier protein